MNPIQLLELRIKEVPLAGRIFAIEYEPLSDGSGGLWCVGLKKPATFERDDEIEIWTNWCKSVFLANAIENFLDGIPNLVIE